MSKMVGTISRGVRAPIIREGDNLSEIVVDCVLEAAKSEPFEIRDKDVIAVTEAVVARAQGNYASVEPVSYTHLSGIRLKPSSRHNQVSWPAFHHPRHPGSED